ncbi:MAG: MBL fold metallo-hydrolase [Dermatophilaceae bacterium]
MKKLAEGVFRLQSATGANGYAIRLADTLVVIDPGLVFSAGKVIAELRAEGALESVAHIFLTHYDMDHAGAAARLAEVSGATTWIGTQDAAILRREASPGTKVRTLMTLVGRPRLPDRCTLLSGPSEPVAGLRAIPTPGHTPGHFAFEALGATFIGDAATVTPEGTLQDFSAALVTDATAARASIEVLRREEGEWVFPGHGAPARRAPAQLDRPPVEGVP